MDEQLFAETDHPAPGLAKSPSPVLGESTERASEAYRQARMRMLSAVAEESVAPQESLENHSFQDMKAENELQSIQEPTRQDDSSIFNAILQNVTDNNQLEWVENLHPGA